MNPRKVGKREVDYLRKQVYVKSDVYNRWRLSIFGTFLKWCGNNIIETMRIGWPNDARVNANWLEPDEAMTVKNTAEDIERVIVTLELDLCMRRIEVLRLRPQDFKGDRVNVLGKGRMGGKWRTVKYRPDTKEIIGEWLLKRERMIEAAKVIDPKIKVPEAFLIHQRGGRLVAYQKSGIDKILTKLRKRVEILYERKLSFSNHTLRRSGGRILWLAGVKIETVGAILGHEDTRTTIKYLGINLDDQDEAMHLASAYEKSLMLPQKVERGLSQRESGPKEIWALLSVWLSPVLYRRRYIPTCACTLRSAPSRSPFPRGPRRCSRASASRSDDLASA